MAGRGEDMGSVNSVALVHALSGAAALVVSVYTQTGLLASVEFVKPLGFAIFVAGMLLFAVAAACLKRAFLGDVEPVIGRIVTTGPYRHVRHPLYLGMFAATAGLALAFRSLVGMLITLVVFVPAGIYRAMLEEQALAQKFGADWENYAEQTGFLFPRICRAKD